MAVTTAGTISTAQEVEVVLKQAKPLKIVREGKSRALSGELEVAISNPGSAPVQVETLDVHGLVFTNTKTAAEHVMLHPCDCAFIAWAQRPPENRTFTLAPGESRTVKVEDWSCGGSVWPPPAAGTWEIRYRVLTKKSEHTKPADMGDPKAMMKSCESTLRSKDFWQHAATSKPLTITLKR